LSSEGAETTKDQLRRWHRSGLLPSPNVVHLGRGKGTESYYPESAFEQAKAIHAALQIDRNLDSVGWRLWWAGFEVDERYWRPALYDTAAWADTILEMIRHYLDPVDGSERDDDALAEEFDRILDAAFEVLSKNTATKKIRSALGRDRFKEFLPQILRMGIGQFQDLSTKPELYDPDRVALARIFDVAMGLQPARQNIIGGHGPWLDGDIAPILATVSALLGADTVRATLAATTDFEISAARREFGTVIQIVEIVFDTVIPIYGKDVLGFKRLAQLHRQMSPRDTATLFVLWLKIRPTFGPLANQFIADNQNIVIAIQTAPMGIQFDPASIRETKAVFPYDESKMQ